MKKEFYEGQLHYVNSLIAAFAIVVDYIAFESHRSWIVLIWLAVVTAVAFFTKTMRAVLSSSKEKRFVFVTVLLLSSLVPLVVKKIPADVPDTWYFIVWVIDGLAVFYFINKIHGISSVESEGWINKGR